MFHSEGGQASGESSIARTEDGDPKLEDTEMDSNFYFHPTDPHWVEAHLLRMQAVGKEPHRISADPLFFYPSAGDFSFQAGSPALLLGIEPLDVLQMGRIEL
jgi:hypothetical protein